MKTFLSHLAQDLSSHVEQGSQPALALFRVEQWKSQKNFKTSLSKPSPCMAALHPRKREARGALSHPTAGASSSSEMEMSEPPRGSGRGVGVQRWEELQVFPFSCLSPGRQAGLNTSIQNSTEKINSTHTKLSLPSSMVNEERQARRRERRN